MCASKLYHRCHDSVSYRLDALPNDEIVRSQNQIAVGSGGKSVQRRGLHCKVAATTSAQGATSVRATRWIQTRRRPKVGRLRVVACVNAAPRSSSWAAGLDALATGRRYKDVQL